MEITARQITTHFERIGHGPILVLLHGWGCDWQIFSPIIPTLSDHFQLLIPDLPAFGQSHTPNEVWDTPDYVEWLSDFLRQTTDTKTFSLLGHSYGGKVAAWYTAQLQPPQAKHLVLCDASGIPTSLTLPQKIQQHVLAAVPQTFKNQLPTQLKQRLLKATNSSSDHFLANPAQKSILRQVVREDIRPQLARIETPTLLLWGEQDRDTPLTHAQIFNNLIKHSELSIFSGVGHFPFIEQPARFSREVLTFTESAK